MISTVVLISLLCSSTPADLPSVTPDAEFVGVDPPGWVLDGAAKVFLSLEDPASMEEAAKIGATILHAGGPSLYYPLRRDDSRSGLAEPERSKLLAGIAAAKKCGMRVVLGVSPYAPSRLCASIPSGCIMQAMIHRFANERNSI